MQGKYRLMKINMETDYALRIMRCIANNGGIVSAASIADSVSVSQRFTLKILGKLVSGGVLFSHKGKSGGYELARPADEITLRSVIEVIEGPIVISRCLSQDFVCSHDGTNDSCNCYFNRVFDEINMIIAAKLDSVTIKDSLSQ